MSIAVLTSFDNAKLRYIIDYVFAERLGFDYVLNPAEISSDTFVLSTAQIILQKYQFLTAVTTLQEFRYRTVCTTDADNNVYLFASDKSRDISFDIFAAIFLCLAATKNML